MADRYLRVLNRRRALGYAVAGLGFCAAVVGTTFAPGAPLLPFPLWLVIPILVLSVFPLHLRTVLIQRKVSWRFRPLILAPSAVLAVALIVIAVHAGLTTSPPEQHGGRYFLNDHGFLTQVTHAGYLHAVALNERLFAATAGVFYLVGLLVNLPPQARHCDEHPRRTALAFRSTWLWKAVGFPIFAAGVLVMVTDPDRGHLGWLLCLIAVLVLGPGQFAAKRAARLAGKHFDRRS